ncbi:GPP34 family phosphoprotein [Amycolatopsis antarctica]|uniref:GPP34 family phosphoprotein n=1 Tax=Amycolatopsis antarctica TaxID=1854586 RepID=A0A263D6Z6_9PSEU|nr:GPP34 family phosphoprotein [Amycolatopsis antarctica]OZM74240.1 GPP34 family phosphoprotein [Amycolatopsis antarctica]
MLIAEDLVLLVFDDETGKPVSGASNLEYALAGALLIELATHGRVDVTDESAKKPGRLTVGDTSPLGHPVLDDALAKLSTMDGKKPKDAISPLSGDNLSGRLLEALAERGVLRKEKGKVLGLFPTTSWPAEDSRHEEQVRAGLHRVLVDGGKPTEREGALISLLAAIDLAEKTIEGPDPKLVKSRAKEIAEGNWASEAMRKAVEEVTAAVMVAIMVPTVIMTTNT